MQSLPKRADPAVRFLVAGVQKGGTTALFQYLDQCDGLTLAACKEAHFFDNETDVDWSAPDYAPYHALFDRGRGGLWGEATPIYIYWPGSLERIQRYNPEMRLVLCFREPAERAWSHWRMETARGFECEPFSWCIREGRARVAANPSKPGAHRVFSYIERGFYGSQLATVYGRFPREQVLCLRSDELKRTPQAALDRVCAFLGVDALKVNRPLHANLGEARFGSPSDADRRYMRDVFAPEIRHFAQLSGLPVDDWLADQSSLSSSQG